ncbi:hypothetical protein BKA62DRAFT_111804 [Auriculariales sp. MPI-PUGE-AT-0066]|nr:hypothetical protein BKA62DRAFT_111804 [Auriculariales sp. MPI-PUGE-AT-0066]
MSLEEEAATLRTENTERLSKASSEVLLTAHRTLAKSHGVVTSGPRAQATLINAVSGRLRAMLAESGVLSATSKGGDGGGMRLPNGFANDPESWLRSNASEWRICGWPSNLPGARISAWPSAQMYAVLALLLEGRIFLVCTAPSSSTGATRVTAPQHIEPPKARPRKSVAADGRNVTGPVLPESDVGEEGDELEVMSLLDAPELDEPFDAPSPSGLAEQVSAPPDSDAESVQSARKGKGKAKPKTARERMQARKPPPLAKPRVSLMMDGDSSEAQMTENTSGAHDTTDEDSSDEDDSDHGSEQEPGAISAKKPAVSAKPIQSEPGTSGKASGKGRKRMRDTATDDATEPAVKKRKRSRNSFEASYKVALNKEKAEEKAKAKEKKQLERQKAREERAAQKEREKREKRELRAIKEAAKEAELLAQDVRGRRHVVEESTVMGHKRRQSTRSDLGLDIREAKRTKADH